MKAQKLVDICFEVAMIVNNNQDYFKDKSDEEIAMWVATQLTNCGIITNPMGGSWGVIKE